MSGLIAFAFRSPLDEEVTIIEILALLLLLLLLLSVLCTFFVAQSVLNQNCVGGAVVFLLTTCANVR